MSIDRAIDALDLTVPFMLLSVFGAALCLYVNQKTWHDPVAMLDPPALRWLRRTAMTLLGLSLCWGVTYSLQKGWHPWPPAVGMIASIDFLFAVRAVTLLLRSMRRETYRRAAHIFPLSHQPRIR